MPGERQTVLVPVRLAEILTKNMVHTIPDRHLEPVQETEQGFGKGNIFLVEPQGCREVSVCRAHIARQPGARHCALEVGQKFRTVGVRSHVVAMLSRALSPIDICVNRAYLRR